MTPEAFAALGARLTLTQRFHLPMRLVAALPDGAAMAVAGAALDARDNFVKEATR